MSRLNFAQPSVKSPSFDGRCRAQVDLLPLASDNSCANLRCCFALLILQVRIVKLLQAGRAFRAMRPFKATMKTIVSHPVAMAVARLLMQNNRNSGCQFVRMRLVRLLRVHAPQLFFFKDRRQLLAFSRWDRIVCGNRSFLLLRHCPGIRNHNHKSQQKQT